MPIEDGVNDAEQVAALSGGQLFDLLEPAPQPLIGDARVSLRGFHAEELVGGCTKDLGKQGQQIGRWPVGLALVVRDHPLRDAKLGCKLAL